MEEKIWKADNNQWNGAINMLTNSRYDENGIDKHGFNKEGINVITKEKYDEDGYDRFGFNEKGFNKYGIGFLEAYDSQYSEYGHIDVEDCYMLNGIKLRFLLDRQSSLKF